MNFCLGFEKQKHYQAFVSDFSVRVKRKLIEGLIINGSFAISVITQYAADTQSKSVSVVIWSLSKLSITLLWIIGIACIRIRLEKFKKYHRLIFLLFDIFQCCSTINLYPFFSHGQQKRYGGLGLLINGWYNGVSYFLAIQLIECWQIKVLHILFQTILFGVYIGKIETYPTAQLMSAMQSFIVFSLFQYFREKFIRMDFLEKRKLYDDSEAVKSILDDITEGIMIINQERKILYMNQPVQKMFKLEKKYPEDLFSRIKIKSVITSSGASQSPSLRLGPLEFERGQLLVEVLDQFSESLFSSPAHGEDHWILAEAFAEVRGSDDSAENCPHSRNYVIKFTTSFYHENKVIVANISDTTDRDELLSLQDNSKYKTRLLASVSHELRTPLNGSINFTEQALLAPDVPEAVKEKYILPALRSNKLLLCLINDILDFSQIEAHKLRLVFEPKNVIQTAKECLELLEIQAAKKGLELRLESSFENSMEEILNTDHNRLKQVILNLLSNAVKFTFKGRVVLKIEELKAAGPNGQQRRIKVSCRDTGIGISEENQKKLFQAFEKLELGDKVAINSTGVGLGLVISNSIVQHLNGQRSSQRNAKAEENAINFESKKDKGSLFWFEVVEQTDSQTQGINSTTKITSYPQVESCKILEDSDTDEQLNRTDASGPLLISNRLCSFYNTSKFIKFPSRSALPRREKCKCPKVLIVDDDAFNLTALELHLLKLGIPCDSAFNGLIALNKIFERQQKRCCVNCRQYSVIFLDCNMPVMDGIETAKRLRKEIQNQVIDNLSIVCCTAFVQQSELDRALQAGMDSYCTKPVSLAIVKQKIKEYAPTLLNSMN